MIRSRRLAIVIAITGSLAVAWSLGWTVRQLTVGSDTGRLAYRPAGDLPPPIDLARLQQQWPKGLGESGDRHRLAAYEQDMTRTARIRVAGPSRARAVDAPVDLGLLLASADANVGKAKAQVCMSCHDFTKGGPDGIGPNLWGVVGRKVAARPGYAYSSAMTAHGGAWDYEKLFIYLTSPARAVPGNKMSFSGLGNSQDRAAVIRFLSTLGDSPPPLPRPQVAAGGGKVAGNQL